MVVSQDRKKAKSKKAARRVSAGVRQNIPFKTGEVVTRTEVSRKVKNRVVTKSTKVVVPIVASGPPKPPDPPPLPPSDQDDSTPSKKKQKKPRKGPSRSAAVSFPLLILFNELISI